MYIMAFCKHNSDQFYVIVCLLLLPYKSAQYNTIPSERMWAYHTEYIQSSYLCNVYSKLQTFHVIYIPVY